MYELWSLCSGIHTHIGSRWIRCRLCWFVRQLINDSTAGLIVIACSGGAASSCKTGAGSRVSSTRQSACEELLIKPVHDGCTLYSIEPRPSWSSAVSYGACYDVEAVGIHECCIQRWHISPDMRRRLRNLPIAWRVIVIKMITSCKYTFWSTRVFDDNDHAMLNTKILELCPRTAQTLRAAVNRRFWTDIPS